MMTRPTEHIASFSTATLREQFTSTPEPPHGPSKQVVATETIAWLEGIIRDLVATLSTVNDPDDERITLVVQYVELKSRWIGLNTRMNYELFRVGESSLTDMFCGAAISALLEHIELLLDQEDLDKVAEFLAQPMNHAPAPATSA